MNVEAIPLTIAGPLRLSPERREDERGYVCETYDAGRFAEAIGRDVEFLQDVETLSLRKGTLRGLHFQHPPFGQAKLVRVLRGAIRDVVVDMREGSPSFGQHESVDLDAKSGEMLWIPEGFAHGFVTLRDNTLVSTKVSSGYAEQARGRIKWNDPLLHIDWGMDDPILSERDARAPGFADIVTPFGIPKDGSSKDSGAFR